MIDTDYAELRAATARAGKTNRQLAKDLELSEQAYYNKIKGRVQFKNSEMVMLARLLALDKNMVNHIFFDGELN